MSHVAVKRTKAGEPLITDLDAAKAAMAALGFVPTETNKYVTWGSHAGDYPVPEGMEVKDLGKNAVLVAKWTEEAAAAARRKHHTDPHGYGPYELAVVPDKNNPGAWTVMCDFYNGGYGLEEAVGRTVTGNDKTGAVDVMAPLFIQHYRMELDRRTAALVGDSIQFEQNEDGSWVSYCEPDPCRLQVQV